MKQLLLSISAVLLHMSIMAQSPKVVLISGAKYGIGKSTALLFAQKGYTVYATDKDTTDMQEHKQAGCKVLLMDITNEQHITDAVKQITAESRTIDVLVNNAGYGQNGVVEELPIAAIRKQFEVNVFGHIRVTQEVLPLMRAKRDGRIIMVGSLAGEFTMPGSSAYHASKHALESFTDALRAEVNQFNIKVSLVKPGAVKTNFTATAKSLYPQAIDGDPYHVFREKYNAWVDKESNMMQPIKVAEAIYKAATKKKPKTRYRVGFVAKMLPKIKALKSDRGFDKFLLKQLKFKTKKENK